MINREYIHWYSQSLQRDMQLLVFGSGGSPVLFFPTRMGSFYEYEDLRVIEALHHKLSTGMLQLFCVDSIDRETFYHPAASPNEKMARHLQYERYVLEEVVPFIRNKNRDNALISAGCSMGAWHALNLGLRHPAHFTKLVGMSGRYDLTRRLNHYNDLLDGYWDETVYFNMPTQYLSNMTDPATLAPIRKLDVVLAVGRDDVFLDSNQLLHQLLVEKSVNSTLYIWDEEAHRARYWREMVNYYL